MTIYSSIANQQYPFSLPKLPYEKNALIPHFTEENFDYHYGKHHNAYVVKLNELLQNMPELHKLSLEEIILKSSKDDSMRAIFNNAAQIWNHTFYWHSMNPNGGGMPKSKLLGKIEEDFGGFEQFKKSFHAKGIGQFGSGWVWLVSRGGKLEITSSSNADTPIVQNLQPLITCDVWEHAYYIDYRNRRPDYLNVFLDHLVNWEFAEVNM